MNFLAAEKANADAVKECIRKIGPNATFRQVSDMLGEDGRKTSEPTFHKYLKEVFPIVDSLPAQIIEPDLIDTRVLDDFIRFAGAVKAVGGRDKAMHLLGIMDQLMALLLTNDKADDKQ